MPKQRERIREDAILTKMAAISPDFAWDLYKYRQHEKIKKEMKKLFEIHNIVPKAISVVEVRDLMPGNIFLKEFNIFKVLSVKPGKRVTQVEVLTLTGKKKDKKSQNLLLTFENKESVTLLS